MSNFNMDPTKVGTRELPRRAREGQAGGARGRDTPICAPLPARPRAPRTWHQALTRCPLLTPAATRSAVQFKKDMGALAFGSALGAAARDYKSVRRSLMVKHLFHAGTGLRQGLTGHMGRVTPRRSTLVSRGG